MIKLSQPDHTIIENALNIYYKQVQNIMQLTDEEKQPLLNDIDSIINRLTIQ